MCVTGAFCPGQHRLHRAILSRYSNRTVIFNATVKQDVKNTPVLFKISFITPVALIKLIILKSGQ